MFEDPVKQKKYLKIALFGKGGTGKTRFALSFPKPCVIDTEKGTQPYIGKYDFKVKVVSRWKQLEPVLKWLRANPGAFETLVIDSMTVFYLDLIQDIVDYVRNKRGNEILTNGDWGVEKRRYAACLGQLIELPMHIILSFREKDEYEDSVNKAGEEVRKKTGSFLLDADKQTEYLFDLAYRCSTDEDKKAKKSKFIVTCTKTRYDWSPKYATWDLTGKRAFPEIFAEHVTGLLDAPDAPVVESTEPILVVPDQSDATVIHDPPTADAPSNPPPDEPIDATPRTTEENNAELKRFFLGTRPMPSEPASTLDDIKVLMTRAGQMTWPDIAAKCRKQFCQTKGHAHEPFKGREGKELLKSCYGVDSSKELRKPQVDFLHGEFGKVLAGLAFLDRDSENGDAIYIATPMGENEEEVRAKVETMTQ